MIETNEIVILPSATTLATLRRETANRKLPRKTLAVIADPFFNRKQRQENPQQKIEHELEQKKAARRVACMQECLRELPVETRAFIVEYHHGESKKDVRKKMAERLSVPLNALRIRACRVRDNLQKCAEKCVKKTL